MSKARSREKALEKREIDDTTSETELADKKKAGNATTYDTSRVKRTTLLFIAVTCRIGGRLYS